MSEKGVKVRCTRCQHTFRVNKQGPVDASPPPPAPPESDPFAAFAVPAPPPSEQATRPGVPSDVLALLRGETRNEPTRLMPAEVSARLLEPPAAAPSPALPPPPAAPSARAPVPRPPPVAGPATPEAGAEERDALFGTPRTGRESKTLTGIRPLAPGQQRPDIFGATPAPTPAAPPAPADDPFAFLPPGPPAPKPRTDPFGTVTALSTPPDLHVEGPPAAPVDPFATLDLAPVAPRPPPAEPDSGSPEEAWPPPAEARAQLFGTSLEAPGQPLAAPLLSEPIVEIAAGQGGVALALERMPAVQPTPRPSPVVLAPPAPPAPARRSLGTLLVNGVLAALLLALLGAVVLAGTSGGSLSLSTLRSGAAGPLVPRDVSNGLYDTRAGRPVFYVRGEVENRGDSPARVRVRVEIFDGEQRLRTGGGLAGATASPEDLYALASPADGEALRARLDAQAALVAPGARAPFLLTFVEYPPHLARYHFQVSAEPEPQPQAAAAPSP